MAKTIKQYSIDKWALYRLPTIEKLADILTIKPKNINHKKYQKPAFQKLLNLTAADIEEIANGNSYRLAEITDRKGKKRQTEVPVPVLKLLHRRIVDLLSRIQPTEYLYSATKNRSYVENGRQHANGERLLRVDIKKFFPSTLKSYVYDFFRNQLECKKHVAAVLTKICTYDGHLPTGSPLSPILSFYSHKPMFDKINDLANSYRCKMTLYVDDVHISGKNATSKLLWEVKKIIHHHKLGYHKEYLYQKKETKKVTGIIVVDNEIRLRNSSHKAIFDDFMALKHTPGVLEQLNIIKTLAGKVNEATQIDPTYIGKQEYLRNLKRSLQKKLKTVS